MFFTDISQRVSKNPLKSPQVSSDKLRSIGRPTETHKRLKQLMLTYITNYDYDAQILHSCLSVSVSVYVSSIPIHATS